MAGRESLRADLCRLREESPDAFMVLQDPDSEQRGRPIHIELAAWATDIAATLHAKYGSLVDLRVGAMTFPARQLWIMERRYQHWYELRGAAAESAGFEVEPQSPLTIRTGRFASQDVLSRIEPNTSKCSSPTARWHQR
ncbi:hypothetical protein [Kribbella sp. NPDC050459]|uniref:hypothetical protein n=1 Tax=Kribbella sp. NPDC050459 TaxID=3155785 RepID=UPI0033C7B2CE